MRRQWRILIISVMCCGIATFSNPTKTDPVILAETIPPLNLENPEALDRLFPLMRVSRASSGRADVSASTTTTAEIPSPSTQPPSSLPPTTTVRKPVTVSTTTTEVPTTTTTEVEVVPDTTTTEAPEQEAPPTTEAEAQWNSSEASWYGPGFYGNTTACGQRYSEHIEGVAHKTLKCGTKVTFTHNGRTVTVPVIDRGPYTAGRTWDLSRATCLALDHCYTGQIRWRL